MRNWCYFCCVWSILLFNPTKSTDELQLNYNGARLDVNNNDRVRQIMKGASSAAMQPQIIKTDLVDIKSEFNKLNTTYTYEQNWPQFADKLGAVTAVTFDVAGNVVIFHRVDRYWDQNTFNVTNYYQERQLGPIASNTVLAFSRDTGELRYEWGKNMFYMPHGLTIDKHGNIWITDVALHQVFKFGASPAATAKPLLTLGTEFKPGAGDSKFCKPTAVAVLDNGDFFVADGYCNARILKYAASGEKILQWGRNTFAGPPVIVALPNSFAIPHALTLVPDKQLVCTADRENGRVQCFHWENGKFHSQYHNPIIGDRLFSVAYAPVDGGELVIVNGPTRTLGSNQRYNHEVSGFVLNMSTSNINSKFMPNNQTFENPHDVAVTVDGIEIYVAELYPARVHKFVKKGARALPHESADNIVQEKKLHIPSGRHILVAVLMLLFVFTMFILSLLTARYHRRVDCESADLSVSPITVRSQGTPVQNSLIKRRFYFCCKLFGKKSRRHAWDKPEGFKLGGILDRSNRNGFEKLEQNCSDEETELATNMLTAEQYT